ncbi:MAG: hypothetical protein WC440_04975 [Candidatus Omnitrophota bacterium]
MEQQTSTCVLAHMRKRDHVCDRKHDGELSYDCRPICALVPDQGLYHIPNMTSQPWLRECYPIDATKSYIEITWRANSIIDSHDCIARDSMTNFEFLPSVREVHITRARNVKPSIETYTFIIGEILKRINSAQVKLFIPRECRDIIDKTFADAQVTYE